MLSEEQKRAIIGQIAAEYETVLDADDPIFVAVAIQEEVLRQSLSHVADGLEARVTAGLERTFERSSARLRTALTAAVEHELVRLCVVHEEAKRELRREVKRARSGLLGLGLIAAALLCTVAWVAMP